MIPLIIKTITPILFPKISVIKIKSVKSKIILYGETFTATAGTGCIWVVKVETLAVQPV